MNPCRQVVLCRWVQPRWVVPCFCGGFTMIELVAALAIFTMLLGILFFALNTATGLWRSSRVQRREQPAAQQIAELIADDLLHAVADPTTPTNGQTRGECTFRIHNISTNDASELPVIMLAFPRFATRYARKTDEISHHSLERVCYYYQHEQRAFFRSVVPLERDYTKPLGELFEQTLSQDILTNNSSQLAERVVPTFIAHFPEEFDNLETNTLPYMVDLALHLFDKEEWRAFHSLQDELSEEAQIKRSLLGALVSRRMTLPQAEGGSL